ncbi:unnamed protein product [Moneuplotes crassus]|uniref:Protein kinase domain-containing protein n=2 Tax=Euplotes crassus TaxID=5936 RepID=A0AAD1U493_EUPCR|nr:unnamed protein product [Moneuplotes crassus]
MEPIDKEQTPVSNGKIREKANSSYSSRPSTNEKAIKFFSRYQHLKKFEPKPKRTTADEPQQAEQEVLAKFHSTEDKILDFSAYTKKESKQSINEDDLSDNFEGSVDSLEPDEDAPPTIPRKESLKKAKSAMADQNFKEESKVQENNQNIQEYLESTLNINIMKPKNLEEEKKVEDSPKNLESEPDLSLLDSSTSHSYKFYQQSNDNDSLNKDSHDQEALIEEARIVNSSDSDDNFEREAEDELKLEDPPKKELVKKKSTKEESKMVPPKAYKSSSYNPIKKGRFVRKKELEGTIGKGDTLGGLAVAKVEILKFLGSGGEGKVYLGRIVELDQLVAFKQFEIVQNDVQEKKIIEAIKKEMKIVKKLSDKNVVKFFTIHKSNLDGDNAVQYNILMEYCDGGSLDTKLMKRKGKPLKLSLTKSIVHQILSGLKYLHDNRIIHRDMKPANILMDKSETRFKIADFGVATEVMGKNSNTHRTNTGTPWYMAPEVIKNEPYKYPIDIWAVGCILYELVSGKRPYYTCQNKFSSMYMIGNNHTPLEKSDHKVRQKFKDKEITDFLKKCWDPDPSKRAKAGELLEHPFLEGVTEI